jgi:hypothetical protein
MGAAPLTSRLWWKDRRTRTTFERGASAIARFLRGKETSDGFEYRLFLPIEDLGAPQITIQFPSTEPTIPKVYSPPLGGSPHRYPDGSMCLWYPNHPRSQRWEFDDGLYQLLLMAGAHLAREDLWRRSDRRFRSRKWPRTRDAARLRAREG